MVERDEEGRPSKWVTEIEPEYDVNERDSWHALDEYDEALCPRCGQLRSICEDPARTWTAEDYVCYGVTQRMMATRRATKPFEKTQPDADGWHPRDGVITLVLPDDPPPDDGDLG